MEGCVKPSSSVTTIGTNMPSCFRLSFIFSGSETSYQLHESKVPIQRPSFHPATAYGCGVDLVSYDTPLYFVSARSSSIQNSTALTMPSSIASLVNCCCSSCLTMRSRHEPGHYMNQVTT
eukprot:1157727-Pelagomonas_calceolata.AAC.20